MTVKTSIIAVVLLAFTFISSSGQTFINEDFSSGQMPPPGWSIDDFSAQWTISQSAFSGGVIPEGRFGYGTNGSPIITRLISPAIDLTGIDSVKLAFSYYFDWFVNPSPSYGIATRSGPGMEWHTVWEVTPWWNVGPATYSMDIKNSDVNSSQFQFCIFLSGSMSMMDWMYVDNILLLNPLENNAQLASIHQTPSTFSKLTEVKGTLCNLGSVPITSAEIQWQLDGGDVHPTFIDGLNLNTFDSFEFTCADLMDAPIGVHDLKVWVSSVNGLPDMEPVNDTILKSVTRVCYTVPRIPLYEEFTSSTCYPCRFFNSEFSPWCEEHAEDITLVKYQMNFPGIGDPYYIEECGERFFFYNGSWVPWLVGDGAFVDTEMNDVHALFLADSAQAGLVKIQATHSITNQVITVDVNVLPFVNFPGSTLYIAVIEKVTHDNVGDNGETRFEHVLMKMIPNATGTNVDLQERIPFSYSQTVSLSGTNIEEFDDLMVVVWVKKNFSRNVIQSAYSVENASLNTEERLEDILVDGTPLEGFDPDVANYQYEVSPGTERIPDVTGVPFNPAEIVIVIPSQTIPGTTTLDVYAEDLQYYTRYNVNFDFTSGLDVVQTGRLSVFPNPAIDYISIYGAENFRVSVADAVGRQYRVYNTFSGNRISLAGLAPGVYFLKAEKPGCAAIVKKIIIAE